MPKADQNAPEKSKINWKKEIFSIPNLMGYFRILMIPVFLVLYSRAETEREYIEAFIILALSLLTDFFDGKVARRFNMVTELGKALDPIADKLTQAALAIALLHRYPLLWCFLALFLLKEAYMGLVGLYLKKKNCVWKGAQWYGKVCTWVMDIGLYILLLCPTIPDSLANVIIVIMIFFMIYSLIMYVRFNNRELAEANKREQQETHKK